MLRSLPLVLLWSNLTRSKQIFFFFSFPQVIIWKSMHTNVTAISACGSGAIKLPKSWVGIREYTKEGGGKKKTACSVIKPLPKSRGTEARDALLTYRWMWMVTLSSRVTMFQSLDMFSGLTHRTHFNKVNRSVLCTWLTVFILMVVNMWSLIIYRNSGYLS